MADLKPSPVVNNKALALSKLLRGGRDFANKAQIPDWLPLVGGQGVGDILVGKAPEEVENWAYGNYPFQVPEMSNIPVMKTGRHEGVFDALSMTPIGAGGAGQAMITAGGDPRLILSRATSAVGIKKALAKNRNRYLDDFEMEEPPWRQKSLLHPSFAIRENGFVNEDFGDHYLLPHPRAVDPQYNPKNELYNIDVHSGVNPESSESRLGSYYGLPGKTEVLRISASPRFNSFKHYESSPSGALALNSRSRLPDQASHFQADKDVDEVLSTLESYVPGWYTDKLRDPTPLRTLAVQHPLEFAKIRKQINWLRRDDALGRDWAELKVIGELPLSGDNFQALLIPRGKSPYGKLTNKNLLELEKRGVQVIPYAREEQAVEMARELQKKAKF